MTRAFSHFHKIYIANRGEIAQRILSTCQSLKIPTCIGYSVSDMYSSAVRSATESICLESADSDSSYLSIPRILEAIQTSGADAVHPGYGFLAEEPAFAHALEKIGVTFIGPSVSAMTTLGDKIESKRAAQRAGLDIVPGYLGSINSVEEAVRIAREIGYPVILKPTAGGGGKGMRIAYSDNDIHLFFPSAREEAAQGFLNDAILMEKYISKARHIEIQILADQHGNIAAFPERDCSIQRRHQKIIEESPSSFLSDSLRSSLRRQASNLMQSLSYSSAGTVEFLCDSYGKFYFLEVNTRLQVEHAVTEIMSELDIVEWMIRIAAGEKLPINLLENAGHVRRHVMESRVYAEDPTKQFLPCTGRIMRYSEPEDVRVDSGIEQGQYITSEYDPLLSKVITSGPTREQCIQRMRKALNEYVIDGVGNNLRLLHAVLRDPSFQSGEYDTNFVESRNGQGIVDAALSTEERIDVTIAAIITYLKNYRIPIARDSTGSYAHGHLSGELAKDTDSDSIPRLKIYSNQAVADSDILQFVRTHRLEIRGAKLYVGVNGDSHTLEEFHVLAIDTKPYCSRAYLLFSTHHARYFLISRVEYKLNDLLFRCQCHSNKTHTISVQILASENDSARILHFGNVRNIRIGNARQVAYQALMKPVTRSVQTSDIVASPMTGRVISIAVETGDYVERHQKLAVIEAMKMQNVVTAHKSGVIEAVLCKSGDRVQCETHIFRFQKPL